MRGCPHHQRDLVGPLERTGAMHNQGGMAIPARPRVSCYFLHPLFGHAKLISVPISASDSPFWHLILLPNLRVEKQNSNLYHSVDNCATFRKDAPFEVQMEIPVQDEIVAESYRS